MLNRCLDQHNKEFANYGGRGIAVCDRWQASFSAFYADMGGIPPGMTLERCENNGPYSPENCIWATPKQQANNTRKNRVVEYAGERHTLSEWEQALGLSQKVISHRLNRGWTTQEALTIPKGSRRL